MKTFYSICEYIAGAFFNILFVVIMVGGICFITVSAYNYGKSIFEDNASTKPYAEYTVTIPEDADVKEIGGILSDYGLVKNWWIFYIESRLNGTYKYLKPGTYALNSQMDAGEIMHLMQTATYAEVQEIKVTIPEGFTIRQIGELCESLELFTADEFVKACDNYDASYYFLVDVPDRSNRLEGYLFPDTYRLPESAAPEDLIVRMLNRFQEVFDYTMEDRAAELDMTMDEIITVAAMIEKEVKLSAERGICSSIIYNRLETDMPLQMCSTVLYALDKRKDRLLLSDLEVNSPYNTYNNKGLPAGPICSPGKASITAALYPDETSYVYMVVKDEEKGEHFFTSSYNEFLDAKARYNQQF